MKKIIACPRTFSSDALNVLLKLTSKRSPKTEKTEAHCRKYIQSLAAKKREALPQPGKRRGAAGGGLLCGWDADLCLGYQQRP